MSDNLFQNYIKEIYKMIERKDAREESFYEILANLIRAYGQNIGRKIDVTILPKKSEAGNPDFRVWDGESLVIGYIEAKHPLTKNLDAVESSEQLKRYREAFQNLILTNFLEFRLYRNGEQAMRVNIGSPQLTGIVSEKGVVLQAEEFKELLDSFLEFTQPRIDTPGKLAEVLSKKAKIMRDFIVLPSLDDGDPYFTNLYNSFKTHLIEDLSHHSFADLFAQTFTYGLFIAKHQYEMKRSNVQLPFTTKTAYSFIQKSFGILREVFWIISTQDMPRALEVVVDDIIDILNHTDIHKLLGYYGEGKGRDPVYHLYETFLFNYDPERKKKLGIYYTPLEVVSFIVNSVNEILKDGSLFNAQDGLATYKTDSLESSVTLLDPAVGTGTFFVSAIEKAIEEAKKYSTSNSFIAQFIRNHIFKHFFAFEILIAPYVVSHLKVLFSLTDKHGFEFQEGDTINIFLTNTLEFHRKEIGEFVGLFEKALVEEQKKALEVKKQTPILIVIGNPPYSVSSQNRVDPKTDFGRFYESYKQGVRKEERNIQPLSDDYIKFLAFAHWKISQTGKGVVGMITNNSYLDGIIHRDMRRKLYEDFDLIYILNLHGDARRPKRTEEGEEDENVFDIRQGVAIGIFVKPEKQCKKQVFYKEIIGGREKKSRFLDSHDVSNVDWIKLEPREPYWFFTPKEFKLEETYRKFFSLSEIFLKNSSGIKTHRDKLVVAPTKDQLSKNLNLFLNDLYSDKALEEIFKLKNISGWDTKKVRATLKREGIQESLFKQYNYRIFDKQWIYYHRDFITRHREEFMRNLLSDNLSIVCTRILSSPSFQHVFISDTIGDICFISNKGKETNYYFPLWLYTFVEPQQNQFLTSPTFEERVSNIKEDIINKLSSIYKNPVSPEEIFHYLYAVLYSNTYRQKYLEFLQIDFPRVPLTNDYHLFQKLSQLGKQMVEIHLLRSPSLVNLSSRFEGNDSGLVKDVRYDAEGKRVYINETQYFSNIEPEVWNYFIGGYQVLAKWLKDRKGRYLTDEEIRTYIKIVQVLRGTISLQQDIDKLYPDVEKTLIS